MVVALLAGGGALGTDIVIDPVQGDDGLIRDFVVAVGWDRRGEFGDDGAFFQNRIYGFGFLKNAALPHMASYPAIRKVADSVGEATVGFEPTNNGFAIHRLSHLATSPLNCAT